MKDMFGRLERIGVIDGIETKQDITGLNMWSEQKWKPVEHNVSFEYIIKLKYLDSDGGYCKTMVCSKTSGGNLCCKGFEDNIYIGWNDKNVTVANGKGEEYGQPESLMWKKLDQPEWGK